MQHVTRHRSPGMTAIYNAVKINQRNHILDLGACVAANFSFFSRMGCHFHFENFDQAIETWLQKKSEDDTDLVDSLLADVEPERKFDIVLIWDLLSFLPPQTQTKIYQRLTQFIKPNTLIFTTNYVGNYRPSSPAAFKIFDQYYINIESTDARQINLSRITTLQWLKALPNYQVLHSFINLPDMQGGLTEQIICYRPDAYKHGRVFSNAELNNNSITDGQQYKTPALELIAKSGALDNSSVLDLGPRSNANLQLWKTHFTEVFNIDLCQALQRIAIMAPEKSVEYLTTGSYIHINNSTKLDAIIAWDTVNYFNDAQWAALFQRLEPHFKNGTLLYILVYNRNTIPSRPATYLFSKAATLNAQQSTQTDTTERINPPLNSIRMQRMMPGFYVKHSFTAKPGMQKGITEYLLEYKDQSTQAKDKEKLVEEVMKRRKEREEKGL